MARFYASLTNELLGLYMPIDNYADEIEARKALNASRLKSLWCSLYTEGEVDDQILQFGGLKLPEDWGGRV